MTKQISLNTLWNSATSQAHVFHLSVLVETPKKRAIHSAQE
jgi:hypothetical protein